MLIKDTSYEAVYNHFQWLIPEHYNIGVDVCDRHASDPKRIALICEKEGGAVETYTFQDLMTLSNRFANTLKGYGFEKGDRLGILLPQCLETAIAHIAAYKSGGIAIPLFTLFGTDALKYRLTDSGARFLVTDAANLEKIQEIRKELPDLKAVFVTNGQYGDDIDFHGALKKGSRQFQPVRTLADDPALIIYTSGTTGPPKGALHAHRTLLGHLPGVEFPHNFFPEPGDLFWTPADWAWIGGLIDVLLPSWHHGVPVLAYRARKFDAEYAFHLMARHHVKNAFIPPTALKLMREVKNPKDRYDLSLRSIGSGGETLGQELLEWGKQALGVSINEFYGQTEANLVVGNCSKIMEIRPGSMGKPIPGHNVEIIDNNGRVLPSGTIGSIAIKRPDPVMFLEYWNNSKATQNKFIGDWALTGDLGKKDADGYIWFVGRNDDLITSSGYRIGPGEIEDCLLKHPSVSLAAVIGVPDPVRTEVVKAFIVLKEGTSGTPELERQIKDFVRSRLAAHEYPRMIEFTHSLPMTATGKIIRKDLRNLEEKRKARKK